jgi:predicted DNA-binding transcriptional regulator YafY
MSGEPVRAERTERLLNLVLCLMATRRAVSRAEIHASVPGYGPVASGAAFERKFERDKDELRGMGIPIETVIDAHGDVEGYRIARDQYALPPLDFSAAELAVIALAAGVWDEAILGPSATTALRKIEAVQGQPARAVQESLVRVQVSAADAALLPLMAGLREGRVVTFDYRRSAASEVARRRVDPWGVISKDGRWYLVAFDHHRSATRVFRLSRIVGTVNVTAQPQAHPADPKVDLLSLVMQSEPESEARARVSVQAGAGAHLRRMADDPLDPFTSGVINVTAPNHLHLVASLCSAGEHAVVEGPPEVRADVVERLQAVARRHARSS